MTVQKTRGYLVSGARNDAFRLTFFGRCFPFSAPSADHIFPDLSLL